ncbi:MAG TPA: hypothetical protein PLJ21_00625 [Pseudobdellovibrionaceae bacterium]|nr:hypothetical protein [Pseudobdellovibrionaceae bacterium]
MKIFFKFSIQSLVLVVMIFGSSFPLRAENELDKNEFVNITQNLADLFFKKIVPKMSELKINFIVEQSMDQILFFSNTNACSSHPLAKSDSLLEVFRIEILQKTYSESTYEEISYFTCGEVEFLFKEVIKRSGKNLKAMTRAEIFDFSRSVVLKENETQLEYTLYGENKNSSPVFQIRTDRSNTISTISGANSIFYSDKKFFKNKDLYQSLEIQFPIQMDFGSSSSSSSSTGSTLMVEERLGSNPWYLIDGTRVSLVQFQTKVKNTLSDPLDFVLGWVANTIISRFPQTHAAQPSVTSLFQIEFLKNLNNAQAGNFSTIKEFLERMNRGINSGKIVVQDNGF